MVEENRAKTMHHLTSELHDDVTEIYEEGSDGGNDKGVIKLIDELIFKLRVLKTNLIKKEKIDGKEDQ